jgi:hypothetical protein
VDVQARHIDGTSGAQGSAALGTSDSRDFVPVLATEGAPTRRLGGGTLVEKGATLRRAALGRGSVGRGRSAGNVGRGSAGWGGAPWGLRFVSFLTHNSFCEAREDRSAAWFQ